MNNRLIAVLACVAMASLVSCQRASDMPPANSFAILAGSELKDIESGLKPDIRKATGLDLAHLLQLAARVGRNLLIPNKAMSANAKS